MSKCNITNGNLNHYIILTRQTDPFAPTLDPDCRKTLIITVPVREYAISRMSIQLESLEFRHLRSAGF